MTNSQKKKGRPSNISPGDRFGRWLVLHRVEGGDKYGAISFMCRCDCGTERKVFAANLRGKSRSCGCLQREGVSARRRIHGQSTSSLYHVWCGMRNRCDSDAHVRYDRYGGRGIKVCTEWYDFMVFHDWAMANGYAEGLEIHRKDNDLGYSPDNCEWLTTEEHKKRHAKAC